ncbi:MAG: hypothetical protein U0790_17725 [Isosphaeraceae bacterium]
MDKTSNVTVSIAPPVDPTTPEEWQNAVDTAEAFSQLHSAQCYGLVTGPKVNIERCREILEQGRQLGITPSSLFSLRWASYNGFEQPESK